MMYSVNKCTFLCSTLFLLLKFKLHTVIMFTFEHPEYAKDVAIFSFLSAVGQLFIYEMIKSFKQHIPAYVIGIRKCVTVILNILWYGH